MMHNQSVQGVDEGHGGMDNEGPNGYTNNDDEATKTVESKDNEFSFLMCSKVEGGSVNEAVTAPTIAELAVPTLCHATM